MSRALRTHRAGHAPWPGALASAALLTVACRPWSLAATGWVSARPGEAFVADTLSVGWLALVAFVPVMLGLLGERRPLRAGASLALVALGPAFVAFEALGPVAPLLFPLVAVGATLPFAALGALVPRLRQAAGPAGVLAALPLLWLAAEALPGRTWLLGRYAAPLLAIGISQAGLPTMQLARFGGVAGVGLALLACNALLAAWRIGHRRPAAVGLTLLAAATAGAVATAPPRSRPDAPGTVVRVVQHALPDAAYAAAAALPGAREAMVRAFVQASMPAPGARPAALTVWPEGALPGPLPGDGPTGLEPYLAGLGPVLAGAPARVAGGIANAVYLWRQGVLRRVYAKRRLAPFGEDDLVAGRSSGLVTVGGLRVAPLLCFEAAFPALARQAALAGANLIAVLTNDAFARALDVPANHLRLARFRALETGVPLVFASNTGPSAIIDAAGRVLARAPAGRAAVLTVSVDPTLAPTPYLRWGAWPSTVALIGSALLALVAGARGGAARP